MLTGAVSRYVLRAGPGWSARPVTLLHVASLFSVDLGNKYFHTSPFKTITIQKLASFQTFLKIFQLPGTILYPSQKKKKGTEFAID